MKPIKQIALNVTRIADELSALRFIFRDDLEAYEINRARKDGREIADRMPAAPEPEGGDGGVEFRDLLSGARRYVNVTSPGDLEELRQHVLACDTVLEGYDELVKSERGGWDNYRSITRAWNDQASETARLTADVEWLTEARSQAVACSVSANEQLQAIRAKLKKPRLCPKCGGKGSVPIGTFSERECECSGGKAPEPLDTPHFCPLVNRERPYSKHACECARKDIPEPEGVTVAGVGDVVPEDRKHPTCDTPGCNWLRGHTLPCNPEPEGGEDKWKEPASFGRAHFDNETEFSEYLENRRAWRAEITKLTEQLSHQQDETRAQSDEVARLTRERDEATGHVEKLSMLLVDAEEDRESFRVESKRERAQLVKLTSDGDNLRGEVERLTELGREYVKQIRDLRAEVEQCREGWTTSGQRQATLRAKLKEAEKEISTRRDMHDSDQATVLRYLTRAEKAERDLAEARKGLTIGDRRLASAAIKVKIVKSKLAAATDELKCRFDILNAIEEAVGGPEDHEQLPFVVASIVAEHEKYRLGIQENCDLRLKLTSDNDNLRGEVERLTNERDRAKARAKDWAEHNDAAVARARQAEDAQQLLVRDLEQAEATVKAQAEVIASREKDLAEAQEMLEGNAQVGMSNVHRLTARAEQAERERDLVVRGDQDKDEQHGLTEALWDAHRFGLFVAVGLGDAHLDGETTFDDAVEKVREIVKQLAAATGALEAAPSVEKALDDQGVEHFVLSERDYFDWYHYTRIAALAQPPAPDAGDPS